MVKKTCKYNDGMYIVNINIYKVKYWYKNTIYYLYNNLMHRCHNMSNPIFHELSIQLIIELLLTFNRSIKPTARFPTNISKPSM